jgi:hypothetical protein
VDVFALRQQLVDDHSEYIRSFLDISDRRVRDLVDRHLSERLLWPHPLIQLNPAFEPGETIEQFVAQGVLPDECRGSSGGTRRRAIRSVATSGCSGTRQMPSGRRDPAGPTCSPRELARARAWPTSSRSSATCSGAGADKGIQAVVVYPMNALATSQDGELTKFLCLGCPGGRPPVRFARYTGQEDDVRRRPGSRSG